MIDTRLLGGGPPLGEVEALVIFAGVCRGVEALHKHTPPWAHRCGVVSGRKAEGMLSFSGCVAWLVHLPAFELPAFEVLL